MANAIYELGRQAFLEGGIDWLSDTIKVVLVDGGYTPNLATDQFLADIPGGDQVAISAALASKTSTDGTADADDITLSAVTGPEVDFVVVYKDTGSDATSPLIVIFDTGTNLPITPNGGDITVQWDSGANKIFTL